MNNQDVLKYIEKNTSIIMVGKISVEEIGDGNLNYIYRLSDETGKSIVVKVAQKCARISNSIVIPKSRVKTEAVYVRLYKSIMSQFLPEMYYYNAQDGVLVMEDLSNYKILRSELLEYRPYEHLARDIANYLVNELFFSRYMFEKTSFKHKFAKCIANELNTVITVPLYFEEPYDMNCGRNSVSEQNKRYVIEQLYKDESLKKSIQKYKKKFLYSKQAFLHGDLHTGSLFVSEDGMKAIDFEFAFWGPMGFDLGCVIANIVFSMVYTLLTNKHNESFLKWIEDMICCILEYFKNDCTQRTNKKYKKAINFSDKYINSIISDGLAYAGIELIRRTVGLAKVKEIIILPPNSRSVAERTIIQMAKELIMNPIYTNDFSILALLKKSYNNLNIDVLEMDEVPNEYL